MSHEEWTVGPRTARYRDAAGDFPEFEALSIGTAKRQIAIIPTDDATRADAELICELHNRAEREKSAPTDPLGGMTEGAVTMHELFLSYMTAGFTEPQAMQVVTALMQGIARGTTGG